MKLIYYPPENMKKEAVDIKSLFGKGKDVDKNERLYQILQQPNNVFTPETMKFFDDKIGTLISPEVYREYMNFLIELVVNQFKEYSTHWAIHKYNPEFLFKEMRPIITEALKSQIDMLSKDLRKRISNMKKEKAIADKAVSDKAIADKAAKEMEEGGLPGTASVIRKNITKIAVAATKLDNGIARGFLAAIKSNPINYQKQMNQSLRGPMQGWFNDGLIPSKQTKAPEATTKKAPTKAPAKAPSGGGGRANTSLANVFDTINGILGKAGEAILNAQRAANTYNLLTTPEERKSVAVEIKKILESNFFINVEITEESLMEGIDVPEKPLERGSVSTPEKPIPSPAATPVATSAATLAATPALTRTGPK